LENSAFRLFNFSTHLFVGASQCLDLDFTRDLFASAVKQLPEDLPVFVTVE
jgi:hypothetical protein